MHLAVLINHRHWIRGRPHLASSRTVVTRFHRSPHPCVEGLIRGQIGIQGLNAVRENAPKRVVLSDFQHKAHRLSQTLAIEGLLQVVVVEPGLNLCLRRLQAQLS